MKSFTSIFASAMLIAACMLSSCQQSGVIKTKVPARPAGQESVVGFAAQPIDTVRVAIVGLGMRGSEAVRRYMNVPWSKITAVCDVVPERAADQAERLVANGFAEPAQYSGLEGYKELCQREDVDLVYVCTDWLHHVPVALCALQNGKHTAIEVPSATSLADCWALVDASEKYRRHCVILENCCYDYFELNALEMARRGAFGEVMHVEGSYNHNLTPYWDEYWDDWRLKFNAVHKGDVYPTHGLGPVAQVLDINRGDKFNTVVAMETAAVAGSAVMSKLRGVENPDFQNGDVTCTLISTEKGKSVLVEHDVVTYRPYDRMYQIVGTEGYAGKYPVQEIALDRGQLEAIGIDPHYADHHAALPKDIEKQVRQIYENPIINDELLEMAKKVGGHGGMDWIMDYRLCYCLHYGLPVDMDVYDLAAWCCVSELGAISIQNGCAPVEVPDFTRGEWAKREGFKYAFADGTLR